MGDHSQSPSLRETTANPSPSGRGQVRAKDPSPSGRGQVRAKDPSPSGRGQVRAKILRSLILLLTVLLAALSYLPPTWAAYLLPVSLAALPILGISLLLTTSGSKPWRWAHVVSLVLCLPVILTYIPSCRHTPEPAQQTLNILSWNADNFLVKRDTMTKAAQFIRERHPDLICLQERPHDNLIHWQDIQAALPDHRYTAKNSREDEVLNLAILSRYPILATGGRQYKGTYNKYMWADLLIGHDTLRIFNAHLQTTGIKKDNNVDQSLINRIFRNAVIRNHQADDLCHDLQNSPYPIILCADLNDTPSGYPARRFRNLLHDISCQWPLSGTFRHLGGFMKIDYIMASQGISVADYQQIETDWSDHKIQHTKLLIRKK